MARIASLPQGWADEQVDHLLTLQKEWREKALEDPDLPEWRIIVNSAVAEAIEHVIQDSHVVDIYGKMGFRFEHDTFQKHGMPVFMALLTGLEGAMSDKLAGILKLRTVPAKPAKDGDVKPAGPPRQILETTMTQTEGAEGNPDQKMTLKIDLGSFFKEVMKSKK
jgi:hypothetical protein